MKYKRIAIDISKHVFILHGVDAQERAVLRRNAKCAEMGSWPLSIIETRSVPI